jgi:phosphohistidine phosphatase
MTTMKHLYLLRHAKSSWDDPALADHDRPLAPRGRRAGTLIGKHLREGQIEPSLVLCSSARRARETLELVRPTGDVLIERELYGASSDELLDRIRQVPDKHGAVMLIGHNPAIEDLAAGLAGSPVEDKFPTGALATLGFTGPWRALAPGGAELESFVRPRELG